MQVDKRAVQKFWERASCGEELYLEDTGAAAYLEQSRKRYELEPYIEDFAQFETATGKKVLEIGVGLGADHQRFAEAGAELSGIDLTERAVEHVRRRMKIFGLTSNVSTGDAENLPFAPASFDLVYSWGVIHHSPNTLKAIAEIHRVLRFEGTARIMIYHTWSLVGYMLWIRYALLRLKPWMTLTDIYAQYLESPGTKAYSVRQAKRMLATFSAVKISTVLTHGDLLESAAGQRHGGVLLSVARRLWPRALLRRFAPSQGLFMLITVVK
jgi:ubiquinone/menaquinone biosynthesis C-methylase UbiE